MSTGDLAKQQEIQTRPRILVLITKSDVGGAQMHVLQILRELRSEFEFMLATGTPDFLTERAEDLGISVTIIPELVRPIRPAQDARAVVAVFRLIRSLKPDLVHVHSFKAGIVGRLAALFARTPCLFTAHGWSFTDGAPRVQRIIGLCVESILCRLCAGVITISRHDFDLAARWRVGPACRRHLVLNAADQSPVTASPGNRSGRLVTIGRLTPVKNQQLLLGALAELPAEITLVIVGEGPERSALTTMIQRLGLENRVKLAGEVRETAGYLAAATMFVLASDFEGLPLSILEAMSAGLPVVATDVGGVREAVKDHDTGYLVQRRDSRQLAEKILMLHHDPDSRVRMGQLGRQWFDARFTVARFRREIRATYQCTLSPADKTPQ